MKVGIKDRSFDIIIYVVIIIAALLCVLPFFNVASVSLSSDSAVMSQKVTLFPVGFNLGAYGRVLGDPSMIRSLLFTIEITVLFSVIGLFLTICLAYPLSRRKFFGKKFFLLAVLFTMYFNGGIIPNYVNIQNLHMINKIWCLILPLALSPFNMIIMKSFIESSIPDSLEESARLDGCSHLRILWSIIIPLSKPVLATLFLFFAVGRWNLFQDALFYITKRELYPLQLKLNFLISASGSTDVLLDTDVRVIQPEVLKASSIMFASIPIILVYPWLQRYFVKGVMIGAVKG